MTVFDDPNLERQILVTLGPYDPGAAAVVTLYAGTHAYTTEPTDSPANAFFEPIVRSSLVFERHAFSPGRLGGRSIPQRGSLVLANTGDFGAWLDYDWTCRDVTVRMGGRDDTWANHVVILQGVRDDIDFSRNEIIIPVRDGQFALDRQVQQTLYLRTGGNEGGDELKGRPKPITLGTVKNVPAVLVDPAARVYQVNYRAVEGIDAVYDNGVTQTITVDYTVDAANGRFTMVADPDGLVTADVRGDNTGSYITSAGAIMRRLVAGIGPLTDPGDLDTASFTALDVKTTAAIGLYIEAERNLLDVLDEVAESVGAYYGHNRADKFEVGRIDAPTGSASLTLTVDEIARDTLRRTGGVRPRWRQRLGYERNWTVQPPDVVGATVTLARRQFLEREFRVVDDDDVTVKTACLDPDDPDPINTLIDAKADAETEVTRRLVLFSTRRDLMRVKVKTQPLELDIGQEAHLTHGRFGLSAGKYFVIVGMREDAQRYETELELFG